MGGTFSHTPSHPPLRHPTGSKHGQGPPQPPSLVTPLSHSQSHGLCLSLLYHGSGRQGQASEPAPVSESRLWAACARADPILFRQGHGPRAQGSLRTAAQPGPRAVSTAKCYLYQHQLVLQLLDPSTCTAPSIQGCRAQTGWSPCTLATREVSARMHARQKCC